MRHLRLHYNQNFSYPFGSYTIHFWGKNPDLSNNAADLKDEIIFLRKYYENNNLKFLRQTHGTNAVFLDEQKFYDSNNNFWGDGDIAVSTGIPVIIRTADCMCALFFSNKIPFFGGIHAGWRGMAQDIFLKMSVNFKKLNLPAGITEGLVFWIGPHIHQKSYEVGADLMKKFSKNYFLPAKKKNKYHLNLFSAAKDQLTQIGINSGDIINAAEDTFSSKNYYSYRRGDKNRNIAVIFYKGSQTLKEAPLSSLD